MDFINNIHQCNKFDVIVNNLDKYSFNINKKNIFYYIVDNIFINDKKQIIKYFKCARDIIKNKKYNNICELYNSAHNLIESIKKINDNNDLKLNIKFLNDTLEEFEIVYNKFLDCKYKNLSNLNITLSRLVHSLIFNIKNNKCIRKIKENLKNNIKKMYEVNKFYTVQFIASKSKYLYHCEDIYDYCWKLINNCFDINKIHTIYILLVELRKLMIDNVEDPALKKILYYKIDIELIKSELQYNDSDKINFFNSINLMKIFFNIPLIGSNNDSKQLYDDIRFMYLMYSTNCINNLIQHSILKQIENSLQYNVICESVGNAI